MKKLTNKELKNIKGSLSGSVTVYFICSNGTSGQAHNVNTPYDIEVAMIKICGESGGSFVGY
jgi:bacteriocin-like protein